MVYFLNFLIDTPNYYLNTQNDISYHRNSAVHEKYLTDPFYVNRRRSVSAVKITPDADFQIVEAIICLSPDDGLMMVENKEIIHSGLVVYSRAAHCVHT